MKESGSTFTAAPVQNHIPAIAQKYPKLYFYNHGREWEYTFENNLNWLPEHTVNAVLAKLERKLEENTKKQENYNYQRN